MAKGEERPVLYRAVKFQIYPSRTQEEILLRVSENLRDVWNWALASRVAQFELWKAKKDEGEGAEKEVRLPTLFDQINMLTTLREDGVFASTPRNWQEETLDRLNGSFLSFFSLVKKGDKDARPPRAREEGFFQVIPGRSGFALKNGRVTFAPNCFGRDVLSFEIPDYCIEKLAEGKIKKFVLSRSKANLSERSTFWVSIVYEIQQPDVVARDDRNTIYLALGASSIGLLACDKEEVIDLWRPDKHWKPKIDSIDVRLKSPTLVKGSKKWKKLAQARRTMFEKMSRQQRQNHREIVATLIGLGRHFVVTDYVVRSKQGKLAKGDESERSGSHGLNWAAQNTGSIADFVSHLEEKAKEFGGSLTKHKLIEVPRGIGRGHENKIAMVRHLQSEYQNAL